MLLEVWALSLNPFHKQLPSDVGIGLNAKSRKLNEIQISHSFSARIIKQYIIQLALDPPPVPKSAKQMQTKEPTKKKV